VIATCGTCAADATCNSNRCSGGAGAVDAGAPDAAPAVDSGVSVDASTAVDANAPADAGTSTDAGAPFDATSAVDAAVAVDAGVPADATVVADASVAVDSSVVTADAATVVDSGSCTAETDVAFCTRLSATCGSKTANDNCGQSRTVASCGTCANGSACGANNTCAPSGVITVSIANASATEGDSSGTSLTFTVSLSAAASSAVTVQYASSDGTARTTKDYTSTSGTLTIPAGQTSATIAVPLIADVSPEDDETFTMTLSNASGATLGTATATGTIADDDRLKLGSTEPLYTYQWGLKYATSYFKDYPAVFDATNGRDLNVEGAHAEGVKGQGVNVLVLDDGVDIGNPDLAPNVDRAQCHNFDDATTDPTPASVAANVTKSHGTNVAGIIGASQNGIGVMGIAPRITLGGSRFLGPSASSATAAYGGASWSSSAHVINASYGSNPQAPAEYDTATADPGITALRGLPALRGGKGLVYVKASGNEFDAEGTRDCPDSVKGALSCENPAADLETLETNVVLVAAGNAKGKKSSYSNVGSVNWITGLGGEYGDGGDYGEVGSGPTMFSTDLVGCARGYARTDATDSNFLKGLLSNPNCDYSYMNGTSAATPTISGVVSLILSANPNLTWRDVKAILRRSARVIDANYGTAVNRDKLFDLSSGAFTTTAATAAIGLVDGATTARLEYGWITNGAGSSYSNAYGFGLPDASAAVTLAKTYTPTTASLTIPQFRSAFANSSTFTYGAVKKVGQFTVADTGTPKVDMMQIRVGGSICVGSVGFFLKSPAGTISNLSVPYNIWYKTGVASALNYGLGSYAFHGENANGTWEVYTVSGVPIPSGTGACANYSGPATGGTVNLTAPLSVEYRYIAIP
jgi:subtilisin family serine protease